MFQEKAFQDEKVPIFINQWWGDALRKCKISRFDMSVEVLLAEEVVGNILSSSTLSARDDSGESISAVDSMSDFPEIFSASSESSTPLSQFMENLSEGLAANACRRYSFGCDLRSEESSVYEVDTISDTSKAALEDDVNFEFAVDCVSSACFFHDFEIESVISDLEGYMEIEEVTEELLYQLYEATFKGVGEMEEKMELPLERERLNFALIQESFLSAFGIPPNADGNDDVPIVSYGSPKRQSATAIRSKKMIPVIASTGVADLRHFTANNERDASARTMMREEIAGLEMKISGMRTRLKGLLEAKQERISPKREHVDEIDDELMKSKLWMRNARDVLQRHEKLWREVRELEAANLMESSAFKNVLAIETARLKRLVKEKEDLVTLIYFQRDEHSQFLNWIKHVKKRNLKARDDLEERLRKIRKRYVRMGHSLKLPGKMSKKASEKVKAETKQHVERINRFPRQL